MNKPNSMKAKCFMAKTFNAKTRGIKRGAIIKLNEKTAKVLVQEGERRVTWTVSRPLLKKVD